ncbi:MAG: hypothetical protein WAM85_14260 [Terracidiphilus sp.]
MKGFLQRIAASAVRPERTLHPFVGAIFQRGAQEHFADEPRPPGRGSLGAVDRVDAANETKELAERGKPGAEIPTIKQPTVHTAAFELHRAELLIPHESNEENTLVSGKESQREREETPQFLPAQMSRVGETEREEESTKSLPDLTPLVPQLLVTAVAPRSDRDAQDGGLAEPRMDAAQGALSARATRRESLERGAPMPPREAAIEDIQIHIGRIEVVAVPPPVPRAAASARRGMTLDEYLQRHGRGR